MALGILASLGSIYLVENHAPYRMSTHSQSVANGQPQTISDTAGGSDSAILQKPEAFSNQGKLTEQPDVAQVVAYLSALDFGSREQGIKDLGGWGYEHNIEVHSSVAENERYFYSGMPEALLVDVSSDMHLYDAHLICWWTSEFNTQLGHYSDHFHYQAHYSAADRDEGSLDRNFSITSARLAPDDQGRTEMGAVYETCSGSGAPIPSYYLMRLDPDGWQILWRTPEPDDQWRAFHGIVTFTGPGLDAFNITGDIWDDSVFPESNAGPHRWFSDIWERQGDSYRRVQAAIIPSAYNTLTEFISDLSTGQSSQAALLVADESLIAKARTDGLVQPPHVPGLGWIITVDNDVQLLTGPISFIDGYIPGPVKGTTITFKKTGGNWIITDIKKG
jgi:hypothetical protein